MSPAATPPTEILATAAPKVLIPVRVTAGELGKIYSVASSQILEWYHAGIIPAEAAEGRVYRFDPRRVAKVLARRARSLQRQNMVAPTAGKQATPTHLPMI